MKKLLLSLLVLSIIGCAEQTPFEKSIENYVQTNFKDPSSYEKISIKFMDTVTVAKKIAIYKKRNADVSHFKNDPLDKILYFTISHKYRANNSFGALTVHDDIVSMNTEYKITRSHAVGK